MKFNETKENHQTLSRNLAGGISYEPSNPKLALYKLTINNLLEDRYYEDDQDSLDRVVGAFKTAADADPLFPLKLAAYARDEMYLRDIPQLLLVLSAHHDEAEVHVANWAPHIIQRADELCTVTACHLDLFGKPIPKPLKRGIAQSFFNFNRYHFAKYFNTNREVDFRDVMNLVHPNPKCAQAALKDVDYEDIFEKIIKGGLSDYDVDPLEPPKTWEVVISEKGNTAEAWHEVLPDMGLFARLRNLRNMREVGLSGEEIFNGIEEDVIEKSKVYPFRFYQAYRAIARRNLIDEGSAVFLENAIDVALQSVPDNLGSSVVAVDLSGSMNGSISEKSILTAKEIASLFGATLAKKGAEVYAFASDMQQVQLDPYLNPVLTLQKTILETDVGGSTNGWRVMKHILDNRKSFQRIIYLTDMQLWDSSSLYREEKNVKDIFDKYIQQVNQDTNLYMVDLMSYGHLQSPEGYQNVYNIPGWNDKILDFIDCAERPHDIIRDVESFEPI